MSSNLSPPPSVWSSKSSALLVDEESGRIRRDWLDALADDLKAARDAGTDVLVVSSGAIAVGSRHLGLTHGSIRLEEKQAAAASGQIQLAHAYQEALARHDISVAQVLLTLGDTEERRRHLNARSTISQLLTLGAVPVVNENDTVATTEIRFGDNDRLAARVAAMISADTLVYSPTSMGFMNAIPGRIQMPTISPVSTTSRPKLKRCPAKHRRVIRRVEWRPN